MTALGVWIHSLRVYHFPVTQSGFGSKMSETGSIWSVREMTMFSKHVKKSVLVVNANVITFFMGKAPGHLPLTIGILQGSGISKYFATLIDVVGAIYFDTVIIFIKVSDLVLIGYKFPVFTTP